MNRWQRLGKKFESTHPSIFKSLRDKWGNPSVRSQLIISDLRAVDRALAVCLGGRGMVLRLFWFFNHYKSNPMCKTCRTNEVSIDKTTRSFCTFCSGSCRNLDPGFRAKAFDRFGGHPMKDPSVRSKVARTWAKHYEGGHPSRDPSMKLRMHGFRRKSVRDIYGGLHEVQGYEDQIVSDLVCGHVTTDHSEIPTIQYQHDGRTRSYFPDMLAYMPIGDGSMCASGNYKERLIEVKSPWTFLKDYTQNVAKFEAATNYCRARSGMSFWLVVVLKTGKKIWCRNPDSTKLQRLKERLV